MCQGSRKLRIPNEHNEDIGAGLISRIREQAGISKEDWDGAGV